eukprot:CAMPEP_0201668484 /NCGR_PEP_ID=MMETSP0494-20130426/19676_1 /ASSEMBLY_ACC=CAM_ASM_000839 /TAXON_ID=420259 /ORGANISM="Thalassiosira gravida, Strain GMp14c1" /LENGTH=588 /DNA_ID=CAMNT_0048148885 /DNA_START=109 /DNA_END=1872 /DNA_ORIENTATION=-
MNNSNLPAKQPRDGPTGSKPSAKRPRHRRCNGKTCKPGEDRRGNNFNATGCHRNNSHATPSLSSDALFVVMSFLHPRDLFHASFTCKTLRDMVTTKMVVQSALIHGGHAMKTMDELHALISSRSIHVPSPMRLLRLACGKVCEFCISAKVNHVRPSLGVFACWECVTNRSARQGLFGLTKPWKRGWVRYSKNQENRDKYDAIFEHPRIAATASAYGMNYYIWSQHRYDRAGESVGPIVAWDNVDGMANHFGSANDMKNGGIDSYLTSNLNAPEINSYKEFNEIYTDMQQKAKAAVQQREEMKRARNQKTKVNKIAKAEKMLDDLTALIDLPFREFALKRTENKRFRDASAKVSTTPCICIGTPFVDSLLLPYIITPSKMKKKILKELAENINSKLRLIAEKKLLTMDFLSDSDPFEAGLKHYLREKLPNLEALFQEDISFCRILNNKNRICHSFFSFLEADKLLSALVHMVNGDISPVLLAVDPSASIARSAIKKYREPTVAKIAESIGFRCLKVNISRSKETLRKMFTAGQEEFQKVLGVLEEYSAWVRDKQEHQSMRIFHLNHTATTSAYFVELLMNKDFDTVYRL